MELTGVQFKTSYRKFGSKYEPTADEKLLWSVYGIPADITKEIERIEYRMGKVNTKGAWTKLYDTLPDSNYSEIIVKL